MQKKDSVVFYQHSRINIFLVMTFSMLCISFGLFLIPMGKDFTILGVTLILVFGIVGGIAFYYRKNNKVLMSYSFDGLRCNIIEEKEVFIPWKDIKSIGEFNINIKIKDLEMNWSKHEFIAIYLNHSKKENIGSSVDDLKAKEMAIFMKRIDRPDIIPDYLIHTDKYLKFTKRILKPLKNYPVLVKNIEETIPVPESKFRQM